MYVLCKLLLHVISLTILQTNVRDYTYISASMIPIDAYRVGDSVVLRPFCLHIQPPGMTFGC